MSRRRKRVYFKREPGVPEPVIVDVRRRVQFSDVDVMGIVWFGRYPGYIEEGSAELGRVCGLSYKDFYETELRAPIIECHIDYYTPLTLDETFTIRASLIWNEGARLNTEYQLIKEDARFAASGYTIQLLTDTKGDVFILSPPLLEECRRRWEKGDLY